MTDISAIGPKELKHPIGACELLGNDKGRNF